MTADLEQALRATLAIEERRAKVFDAMREAVRAGDEAAVIRCARELVGDDEQPEGDRAPARVEPGASRA